MIVEDKDVPDEVAAALDVIAELITEAAEYAGPEEFSNQNIWDCIDEAEAALALLRQRLTKEVS